ncbi:beta-1,3-galactosyltransferase 1-like [Rhinophrynus dorsalis]
MSGGFSAQTKHLLKVRMSARRFYRLCCKCSIILLLSFSGLHFYYKTEIDMPRNKPLVQSTPDQQPVPNHGPVFNLASSTNQYPLALTYPYPYPYKFLKNPQKKCQFRKPFLVLLVLVESHDFATRGVIRETWGKESNYRDVTVVTVFLVGISPITTDYVQKLLDEENDLYCDIVQQDFMDTYYNLTLKTLMGMEWVMTFCPDASYVMKIDNDMFLNVDFLIHHVLLPDVPVRKNYFIGQIAYNFEPIRDKDDKWYVPKEVYPNNTFPPFCCGSGYVFSADMARKIYDVAQVIKTFYLEDVFMGLCLRKLKISPTNPPGDIFIVYKYKIAYSRCLYHKLVMVHYISNQELLQIWSDFWGKRKSGCAD